MFGVIKIKATWNKLKQCGNDVRRNERLQNEAEEQQKFIRKFAFLPSQRAILTGAPRGGRLGGMELTERLPPGVWFPSFQ